MDCFLLSLCSDLINNQLLWVKSSGGESSFKAEQWTLADTRGRCFYTCQSVTAR